MFRRTPRATDRRAFLLASAAVLAGACGPRPEERKQTGVEPASNEGRKVVVIGGGLAGLATAHLLNGRGYDVTVLEAKAHPGGRILTIRDPFRDGQFAEAGAARVVGDPALIALFTELGVPLEQWTRTKGLARVSLFGGKRVVTAPGAPSPPPPGQLPFSAAEEALGEDGRMEKYFALSSTFDPTAPLPENLLSLDAMSGADYLRKQGASAAFIADTDDSLGIGDTGVEGMSALSMIQLWAEILREIKLGSVGQVAGGTDRLPQALATRLGSRLLRDAPVTHVEQSAGGVRVVFQQAGRRSELLGDRVVVAIPPTVLRSLAVTPRFSPEKERALGEVALESVTRAWVQTSERFWTARGESGRVNTDLPLGSVRDESEALSGTAGILGIYAKRAPARKLGALPEDARHREVLDYIEAAHPGAKPHVVSIASKCWDADPYQLGAYLYFKPGQLTRIVAPLARAEGRLHFTGDHTSHRPGFMHGALASAMRVVREIAG
jgi:monoamine oxidase